MAEIGTPAGSSHSAAMAGSWLAGAVKREFGCAAGVGDIRRPLIAPPVRAVRRGLAGEAFPPDVAVIGEGRVREDASWRTSVSTAFGLVAMFVPGATPKKPASGLIARSLPSGPIFIQQMSSPTVSTFQPGIVGTSMARFVLPQAEGKAPGHVADLTGRGGELQDEHVLGEPALVARRSPTRSAARSTSCRGGHCLRSRNRTTRSPGSRGSG